jgi:hypothetical protein
MTHLPYIDITRARDTPIMGNRVTDRHPGAGVRAPPRRNGCRCGQRSYWEVGVVSRYAARRLCVLSLPPLAYVGRLTLLTSGLLWAIAALKRGPARPFITASSPHLGGARKRA